MNSDTKTILTIFISVLIDLLGFTIILPLFPSLFEYYEKSENDTLYTYVHSSVESFRNWLNVPSTEAHVTTVLFGGLLGSLFSFLQFINGPILGALSDHYGRKPIIICSLIGSSIACLIWANSLTFTLFIFARVVAGLSEGNISICIAALADFKDDKVKSKGMAFIGVAYSIGFTVGPSIGAYYAMGSNDLAPAYLAFAFCIIDIIFVWFVMPETLKPEDRSPNFTKTFGEAVDLINPTKMFTFRSVDLSDSDRCDTSILGLTYFTYLFFFSGLEFTLTFLTHNRYGFTRMDQGKMFACMGIIMSLVQGGYVRRAMVNNEINVAKRSIILLIIGFITVGLSTYRYMLYLGLIPFAFAAASVIPSLTSAISKYGNKSQKGRLMGTVRALGALARATGPTVCATSYWLFGSSVTYIIGGLMLLIPFKLLSILQKIETKRAARINKQE